MRSVVWCLAVSLCVSIDQWIAVRPLAKGLAGVGGCSCRRGSPRAENGLPLAKEAVSRMVVCMRREWVHRWGKCLYGWLVVRFLFCVVGMSESVLPGGYAVVLLASSQFEPFPSAVACHSGWRG